MPYAFGSMPRVLDFDNGHGQIFATIGANFLSNRLPWFFPPVAATPCARYLRRIHFADIAQPKAYRPKFAVGEAPFSMREQDSVRVTVRARTLAKIAKWSIDPDSHVPLTAYAVEGFTRRPRKTAARVYAL